MRRLGFVIVLLACFSMLPSVLHAQSAGSEWGILSREAFDLYRAGKYRRAAVVAQNALEVAVHNVGPNHPNVATSPNNLAVIYQA